MCIAMDSYSEDSFWLCWLTSGFLVLLNSLGFGLLAVVDVAFALFPCVVCLGFRELRT